MKLYNADLSPYAARIRLAARHKGLAIDFVPPPEGGIKSEAYLALNPMGKIPVLVLDNGATLPESETILEYLEDAFPTPSLRPSDLLLLARARLIARIGDIYVQPTIFPLFSQMNPATRDPTAVETHMTALVKGLGWLELYIGEGNFAVGDKVTIADCSLIPVLFFVDLMAKTFGRPDLLANHPKVAAYWAKANAEPIAANVIQEMTTGFQNFVKRQS